MYCSKCGNEISNSHAFCTNCGEKIVSNNENTNLISKPTTVNTPRSSKLKYGVLLIGICIIFGSILLFSTHKSPKTLIIGKWNCIKGENFSLDFTKGGIVSISENNRKAEAYNYTIEDKSGDKDSAIIKISKAGNNNNTETLNIRFKDKNNFVCDENSSDTLEFTRSK